jgi:putative transcriptional regulator
MTKMTHEIKHHLSDDILMAYSAGALPEAFNLMVASHVSLCDACRAQLESFDAVGGALLEDGIAEMSETSLADTIALIAGHPPEPRRPTLTGPGVLPAPLRDYVGGDLDAIRWRPVGMGVKQAILPTSREASARLLFIPAGGMVPDHSHNGMELTMVLQGAFSDEDDRFARGDVEIADQDIQHTPIAEFGVDCICLAVTDAPLKFTGLIPRIVQPFLRI